MSGLLLPTSIPDWAAAQHAENLAQHAEILAILGRIQRHLDALEVRTVTVPEPW
jgi:hypothetical protein